MLKFLKGVVGSGGGIKDLPYNIGEPYSTAWGGWTHCRGTSKVCLSCCNCGWVFSCWCLVSQVFRPLFLWCKLIQIRLNGDLAWCGGTQQLTVRWRRFVCNSWVCHGIRFCLLPWIWGMYAQKKLEGFFCFFFIYWPRIQDSRFCICYPRFEAYMLRKKLDGFICFF
jgi:hypothetical protein